MRALKQSTAVDVLIGPFVDRTDGYTAEEAESPSVLLSKNGQALAAKNDATTPTHDDAGYYNCELDATDTNTVGALVLIVEASANALPVRHDFQVMEEAIYDALFGASATGFDSNGRVDIGKWLGTAVTTSSTSSKPEIDVYSISDATGPADKMELYWAELETGTAQGGSTANITLAAGASSTNDFYIGDIVLLTGGTGEGQARQVQSYNGSSKVAVVNTNWATQPDATSTYIITPGDWTLSVVAEMQSGVLTAAAVATDAIDADALAADAIAEINATVDTAISDASLATAAALATVDSNVDAILVDTGTTLPATLTTIEGKIDTVDTNVDAILVDTGTTLPGTLSTIDTNVDAILVDTGTTLPATLTTIEGKIDTIDTNVDAILVDTGTTLPASISGLNDISVSDVLTTQMTESYAADGAAPTVAQALMLIQQSLTEMSISGTTVTIKRVDGSTTAATLTLDDGTTPTSKTRAT